MNLKELDSFRLADAISFHDKLNPKLFRGTKLLPVVKDQLITIAQDFLEELGIHDLDVRDITISGSNAAYTYTPHSDLDLHILIDMNDLPQNEVYKELFNAKKTIYNDTHDITVHGVPVELYVQDTNEPVKSLGEYSIKNDKWLRIPTKQRANFDQTATKAKYNKLLELVKTALKTKDSNKLNKILKKIKQYRQAGLDKAGEFGPENLAYKALRSQGYITKLYDLRDKLHSARLSIEGMYAQESVLDKPTPTVGDLVKKHNVSREHILDQLLQGIKVETEHTSDESKAREIALDHLGEDPNYYTKLKKANLEEAKVPSVRQQIINDVKKHGGNINDYFVRFTDSDKLGFSAKQGFGKTPDVDDPKFDVDYIGQGEGRRALWFYPLSYFLKEKNDLYAANQPYAWLVKLKPDAWMQTVKRGDNKVQLAPQGKERVGMIRMSNPPAAIFFTHGFDVVGRYYDYAGQHKSHGEVKGKPAPSFFDKVRGVDEDVTMQFSAEKTPAINPYGGLKDTQFRSAIGEGFDQPYPLKWEKSEFGDYDAHAQLPDGTGLEILFNNEEMDEWDVIFYRGGTTAISGKGDAQRVFATVLHAIGEFIKKEEPESLKFSAEKADDPKGSRANLYTKLVQRYASSWGYRVQTKDQRDAMWYRLVRIENVKEDAANNKITLKQLYNGNYPDRDELFWDEVRPGELDKPLEVKVLPKHKLKIMLASQYRVEHLDELFDMMDDEQKDHVKAYTKDPNLSDKIIVISGDRIIDGNHRALAAAVKNVPIKYVDLVDLENDLQESASGTVKFWNEPTKKFKNLEEKVSFITKQDIDWRVKLDFLDTLSSDNFIFESLDENIKKQVIGMINSFQSKNIKIGENYIPILVMLQKNVPMFFDINLDTPPKSMAQFGKLVDVSNDQYKFEINGKTLTYPNDLQRMLTYTTTILVDSPAKYEKLRSFVELTFDTLLPALKTVNESASGYIPSNAEKDDPRFKTALTVDIKPDTMKKNAKKFGFKISRAGIPPLLRESKGSIVAFHGTRNEITQFKPFTHFGTFMAAKERLEHTSRGQPLDDDIIYKVSLHIKNPAPIKRDINRNHELEDYVTGLIDSRVLDKEYYHTIKTPQQLVKVLRDKGYDGISYFNTWEDSGSTSYVIFDSSQATITDIITYENDKMYQYLKKYQKKRR